MKILRRYASTLSDAMKMCIARTGRLLQKKKSRPHPFDITGEINLFEEDSKAHPFDALGKALFLATEDILRTYDRRPLHPTSNIGDIWILKHDSFLGILLKSTL